MGSYITTYGLCHILYRAQETKITYQKRQEKKRKEIYTFVYTCVRPCDF